jgi:hypothetical protein
MKEFIGYFASFQGDRVIVNEDHSVIVFGKKHDFISYHENHLEKVTGNPTYKKIYYSEIMKDIYEGNSFAFDEISYNRFYPIAQLNGYDFGPADFSTDFCNNYEKKFATLKIEPKQK